MKNFPFSVSPHLLLTSPLSTWREADSLLLRDVPSMAVVNDNHNNKEDRCSIDTAARAPQLLPPNQQLSKPVFGRKWPKVSFMWQKWPYLGHTS